MGTERRLDQGRKGRKEFLRNSLDEIRHEGEFAEGRILGSLLMREEGSRLAVDRAGAEREEGLDDVRTETVLDELFIAEAKKEGRGGGERENEWKRDEKRAEQMTQQERDQRSSVFRHCKASGVHCQLLRHHRHCLPQVM